ncbi:MAG: NAD-dependent succinate-semialdehyde dehydrogenase [Simkaniaceae bacterium]
MKTFAVTNPATGEVIGEVPDQGKEETQKAIQRGQEAFHSWSRKTPKERGEVLKRWHQLTLENVAHLAKILHLEQGKPLHEAEEEIYDGALFLEWCAEEAKRVHGYTALSPDPSRRFMTIKQPIGVVGVITPWNFPSALPLQKCVPAISVGCTVILKPSEETPLSALEQAKLAQEAGLPEGVLSVISCLDPQEVGQTLMENPLVRKITFTGSTEVGRLLMEQAGKTVKKISLELEGNSPLLVFEDANSDLAVEQAISLKFYNCGQVCNTINRFFIHEKLYGTFVKKFHKHMETLKLGPLINATLADRMEWLLRDAKEKGAHIIGGKRRGLFFEPTLVTEATPHMALFHEEIFGPVAPFYRFSSEEEVLALANATEYGLAAYVFTENMGRSLRVAEALEAGSVGINTTAIYSELLPFGGWKQSGLGREMGLEKSLDPFLETKSLVIGGI